MKYAALALALLCTSLSTVGSLKAADDTGAWGKLREACKADREKLCANASNEENGPRGCLRDHAKDLSADCAAALKAADDAREKLTAACSADIDKICAAQKGKGRKVMECLREHVADLSAACADHIKSHMPAKAQ